MRALEGNHLIGAYNEVESIYIERKLKMKYAFFAKLQGKEVFLFGTAGFGGEAAY